MNSFHSKQSDLYTFIAAYNEDSDNNYSNTNNINKKKHEDEGNRSTTWRSRPTKHEKSRFAILHATNSQITLAHLQLIPQIHLKEHHPPSQQQQQETAESEEEQVSVIVHVRIWRIKIDAERFWESQGEGEEDAEEMPKVGRMARGQHISDSKVEGLLSQDQSQQINESQAQSQPQAQRNLSLPQSQHRNRNGSGNQSQSQGVPQQLLHDGLLVDLGYGHELENPMDSQHEQSLDQESCDFTKRICEVVDPSVARVRFLKFFKVVAGYDQFQDDDHIPNQPNQVRPLPYISAFDVDVRKASEASTQTVFTYVAIALCISYPILNKNNLVTFLGVFISSQQLVFIHQRRIHVPLSSSTSAIHKNSEDNNKATTPIEEQVEGEELIGMMTVTDRHISDDDLRDTVKGHMEALPTQRFIDDDHVYIRLADTPSYIIAARNSCFLDRCLPPHQDHDQSHDEQDWSSMIPNDDDDNVRQKQLWNLLEINLESSLILNILDYYYNQNSFSIFVHLYNPRSSCPAFYHYKARIQNSILEQQCLKPLVNIETSIGLQPKSVFFKYLGLDLYLSNHVVDHFTLLSDRKEIMSIQASGAKLINAFLFSHAYTDTQQKILVIYQKDRIYHDLWNLSTNKLQTIASSLLDTFCLLYPPDGLMMHNLYLFYFTQFKQKPFLRFSKAFMISWDPLLEPTQNVEDSQKVYIQFENSLKVRMKNVMNVLRDITFESDARRALLMHTRSLLRNDSGNSLDPFFTDLVPLTNSAVPVDEERTHGTHDRNHHLEQKDLQSTLHVEKISQTKLADAYLIKLNAVLPQIAMKNISAQIFNMEAESTVIDSLLSGEKFSLSIIAATEKIRTRDNVLILVTGYRIQENQEDTYFCFKPINLALDPDTIFGTHLEMSDEKLLEIFDEFTHIIRIHARSKTSSFLPFAKMFTALKDCYYMSDSGLERILSRSFNFGILLEPEDHHSYLTLYSMNHHGLMEGIQELNYVKASDVIFSISPIKEIHLRAMEVAQCALENEIKTSFFNIDKKGVTKEECEAQKTTDNSIGKAYECAMHFEKMLNR